MSSRSRGSDAAVALLCLILCTACGKQSPPWQAVIKDEGGVVFVKNPSEPRNPELRIEFEEDLTIGVEEGDEDYMLGGSILVNSDDEGNLYVSDGDVVKVRKYDPNGRFLHSLGGPGQGPGEFQELSAARFDADGNIYLNDVKTQRISILDPDGRYLKGIRVPFMFERVLKTSRGFYVARSVDNVQLGDGKKWDYYYGLFDADFNLMAEFLRQPQAADVNKTIRTPAQALADAMSETAFVPAVNYALGKDDLLYFVYPERYEINVYSTLDGRLVRVVQREFEPSEVGRRDKKHFERIQRERLRNKMPAGREREVFELVQYPKYKPAYENIFLMENGWIFVLVESSGGGPKLVDIFDHNGEYLAQFETKIATDSLSFNNGYAYAVATVNDYRFVKRYTVEILGSE